MDFMTYKGYPLVRSGDDLYFGYMSEPHVVMLQAEGKKEVEGIAVSEKVRFYLMSTDQSLDPIQAIVRTSERESLYEALEVATTWLERSNA